MLGWPIKGVFCPRCPPLCAGPGPYGSSEGLKPGLRFVRSRSAAILWEGLICAGHPAGQFDGGQRSQTQPPFLGWYHTVRVSLMANNNLKASETVQTSAAALHQLKKMVQQDPAFAKSLQSMASTEDAAKLVAEHGVTVTPEALWRHRGTLISGGLPTWRG